MDPELPPPPLTLLTARLTLRSSAAIEALPTPGVALRGGLGAALQRTYCAPRIAGGDAPPHDTSCPYCTLFTPGVRATSGLDLHGLADAPRPYVIHPPLQQPAVYRPGAPLAFDLILIGWAVAYLPAVVAALRAQEGLDLTQGRGRAPLSEVATVNPLTGRVAPLLAPAAVVPAVLGPAGRTAWAAGADPGARSGAPAWTTDPAVIAISEGALAAAAAALPDTLTLYWHTPLRLKARGQWVQRPDPYPLVVNALRRLGALCTAYGAGPWALAANQERRAALLAATDQVRLLHSQTQWLTATRQPGRGNPPMPVGGLVGYAVYSAVPPALRLVLLAGSLVHIGDDVVFGNGAYTVLGGAVG